MYIGRFSAEILLKPYNFSREKHGNVNKLVVAVFKVAIFGIGGVVGIILNCMPFVDYPSKNTEVEFYWNRYAFTQCSQCEHEGWFGWDTFGTG